MALSKVLSLTQSKPQPLAERMRRLEVLIRRLELRGDVREATRARQELAVLYDQYRNGNSVRPRDVFDAYWKTQQNLPSTPGKPMPDWMKTALDARLPDAFKPPAKVAAKDTPLYKSLKQKPKEESIYGTKLTPRQETIAWNQLNFTPEDFYDAIDGDLSVVRAKDFEGRPRPPIPLDQAMSDYQSQMFWVGLPFGNRALETALKNKRSWVETKDGNPMPLAKARKLLDARRAAVDLEIRGTMTAEEKEARQERQWASNYGRSPVAGSQMEGATRTFDAQKGYDRVFYGLSKPFNFFNLSAAGTPSGDAQAGAILELLGVPRNLEDVPMATALAFAGPVFERAAPLVGRLGESALIKAMGRDAYMARKSLWGMSRGQRTALKDFMSLHPDIKFHGTTPEGELILSPFDRVPLKGSRGSLIQGQGIKVTDFDAPDVIRARRKIGTQGDPTDLIRTPSRETFRRQTVDIFDQGTRATDREAWIVIGKPGAGKSSTIVDQLLKQRNARLIDPDQYLTKIPEYAGGDGYQRVLNEARNMSKDQMNRSLARGENIVVATLGRFETPLTKQIQALQDSGYRVHLSLVEVKPKTSASRVISRWRANKQGFIPPEFILSEVDDRPEEVFRRLTQKPNFLQGFSHFSNQGKKPVLLKSWAKPGSEGLGIRK